MDASREFQTNTSFFAVSSNLKRQVAELGVKSDADNDSFWFTNPNEADFHFILSSSIPGCEKAFHKLLKARATQDIAVTSIALKRFQLKHGRYPTQLSELTPEFLKSVPFDLVDGQLLRYRPNSDGTFLLYSIGDDGIDDGGNPARENGKSRTWQDGRDWVWPQPATPEEIRTREQNQSMQK